MIHLLVGDLDNQAHGRLCRHIRLNQWGCRMRTKSIYICSNCNQEFPKWQGKCDSCQQWNTLEETIVGAKSGSKRTQSRVVTPKRLSDVQSSNSDRIVTSITEFNRVMGGGIVKDSITIITAKPGAGKSTLLLQVSEDIAQKGLKVLYASGEESDSQIKNRAERILGRIHKNIWVYSDTNMNNVLASIDEIDPDLIIVDSIQTFVLEEYSSRPGSPTQTMECANELLKVAKGEKRPRAVIMVGQMTKDDEIAGLRALEHLVDTVLIINGEDGEELKGLSTSKNRYGSTGEIGFFSMTEKGMLSIENPSEYFMTKRESTNFVSGSALSVVKEGSRPVILEIESLVSTSFYPYPSRIGECMKKDQLNTLISILEQRGGIELFSKNVVVKTTGGLRLKEQSVNLAVIMSIVSSVKDRGIPNDVVFIADIGLTGELKRVPSIESRIRELDRMGFQKVYVAKNAVKRDLELKKIELFPCNNLNEVIMDVFE
jgi:DNA repair protein RadA/Sms